MGQSHKSKEGSSTKQADWKSPLQRWHYETARESQNKRKVSLDLGQTPGCTVTPENFSGSQLKIKTTQQGQENPRFP